MFINSHIKSIREQSIMLPFQAGYVRKSAQQKGSEAAWTHVWYGNITINRKTSSILLTKCLQIFQGIESPHHGKII